MKTLKIFWKNYKYRFTPWLALNLAKEAKEPNTTKVDFDHDQITDDLLSLFKTFQAPPFNCHQRQVFQDCHDFNSKQLMTHWGFQLEVKTSTIPNGGRGVFVKHGTIRKGQVACLYPGLVYKPWQPIFLSSIRNAYIFKCADGTMLDGKSRGLSKILYKSVHGRERVNGFEPVCDVSWTNDKYTYMINPLSIGQIVNNHCKDTKANVMYEELNVQLEHFYPALSYLPNVNYASSDLKQYLRLVPLIAIQDIEAGQELFSTYFSIVQ